MTTSTRQPKTKRIIVDPTSYMAPRYAVGQCSKYSQGEPTPVAYFAYVADAWRYVDQENAKARESGLASKYDVHYTCWDIFGEPEHF